MDDDRTSDGENLQDWRSRLSDATAARARESLSELLTMPIVLTPCIERGYRAIRFEGRLGLAAIFSAVVTNLACQNFASWNPISDWLRQLDGLRTAA